MKKYIFLLFGVILTLGCGRQAQEKKEILARVNNYEISRQEFNEEFRVSGYGRPDTQESRREFLNILINRKLILQDAQKNELDKDENFLKMIEKFWEQSLLKLTLDKKAREISGSVQVSDKSIEEAYQKMAQEGKADKPYDQMYQQVKWELTKSKETQLLDDWVVELHKQAQIEINYDLLREK